MLMEDHSATEGETDAVHSPHVLGYRPACSQHPLILTLEDRNAPRNPTLDHKTEDGKVAKPWLCNVDVRIGDVLVDACIDSGTTFSLLSEKVYMSVQEECGVMMKADDVKL